MIIFTPILQTDTLRLPLPISSVSIRIQIDDAFTSSLQHDQKKKKNDNNN